MVRRVVGRRVVLDAGGVVHGESASAHIHAAAVFCRRVVADAGVAVHVERAAVHIHAAAVAAVVLAVLFRRVFGDAAAVHGKLTTGHIHAAAIVAEVRRVVADAAAVHIKSAVATHIHAAAGLARSVGDLAVCVLTTLAVAEGEGVDHVDGGFLAAIHRDVVTVQAEHRSGGRRPSFGQRHICVQIVFASFFAGQGVGSGLINAVLRLRQSIRPRSEIGFLL